MEDQTKEEKNHSAVKIARRLKGINKVEKEKLLMAVAESARYYESFYRGCCRSTLAALQSHLGLENHTVIRAATALGGGVARTGETCGALLGGLMAVGLIFSSDELDDSRNSFQYAETMRIGSLLCDEFEKKFGALRCHDVQLNIFGRFYDLKNSEHVELFRNEAHAKCEDIIAKETARLTTELILRELHTKDF